MTSFLPVSAKAAELRRAFDQSRATPLFSGSEEQTESLLALRVSRDAFAIKLSEITGLATDKKLVSLPSPIPELLGLVGIRGALVPVYSLQALLGYGAQIEETRWMVLCGAEESFALAFRNFEGSVSVPRKELYTAEPSNGACTHIKEAVRAAGIIRGIVSVPSVLEAITRHVHEAVRVRSKA